MVWTEAFEDFLDYPLALLDYYLVELLALVVQRFYYKLLFLPYHEHHDPLQLQIPRLDLEYILESLGIQLYRIFVPVTSSCPVTRSLVPVLVKINGVAS